MTNFLFIAVARRKLLHWRQYKHLKSLPVVFIYLFDAKLSKKTEKNNVQNLFRGNCLGVSFTMVLLFQLDP